MAVELGWSVARGPELVEGLASSELGDVLPKRSAVYMWKRNLQGIRPLSTDADTLVQWLDTQISVPHGRVASQQVGHFIALGHVELRSPSLSPQKRESLRRFAQQNQNRRWLITYLAELAQHAPALYVGETGNIRTRAAAHLRGDTDFGQEMGALENLEWEDVDLYYYDLGPPRRESGELRKAIEYITTAFSIGAYTRRPG
ncbi:MAG: hypothetical protein ACLFWH_06340 [Actinomycetota bacterium]